MSFQFILSCLYFFLPAYFTNMTPPLANRFNIFNFLDKPIDFGKKFLAEPLLGSHKTWRGVILGIIVGILIIWLQTWLYQFPSLKGISFINYSQINILFFGFLISGGAIFGDLFFAFLKRRLKLKPGTKFLPFDQINYVIGSALFLTPFFKINILVCPPPIYGWWGVWITLIFLTFFLHIIFNRIGYYLKFHQAKW